MGLSADAFTFLQPFSWQLWVCLVLMTFGVAMVLTMLARLSPLGLFDIRKVTNHSRGRAADMRQYAVHDGMPVSLVPFIIIIMTYTMRLLSASPYNAL